MTEIDVKINQDGTGRVLAITDAGPVDISAAIAEVRLIARPGQGSRVELVLPGVSSQFTAEVELIDEKTTVALVALGWTPPPDPVATSSNEV